MGNIAVAGMATIVSYMHVAIAPSHYVLVILSFCMITRHSPTCRFAADISSDQQLFSCQGQQWWAAILDKHASNPTWPASLIVLSLFHSVAAFGFQQVLPRSATTAFLHSLQRRRHLQAPAVFPRGVLVCPQQRDQTQLQDLQTKGRNHGFSVHRR